MKNTNEKSVRGYSEQKKEEDPKRNKFDTAAKKCADAIGSPIALAIAITFVLGWLLLGPFTGFSDTWQLWVNTISTISTGLLVFVIQNTQNRSDLAIHKKLDGIINGLEDVSDDLQGIEQKSEEELKEI